MEDTGLYDALAARDRRFDGVFFVGVTSTGIYCRPICPARTPRRANCRFFRAPHDAELAGFRPCLRCRPELAPGLAPVDDGQRIALLIMERLENGTLGEAAGLEAVAEQFELSSRQIRRIVQHELGVPPIQLLMTRRLLLAKQLLTDTALPITQVAFASGFSSLRRFNDAFARRYGLAPTALRRNASPHTSSGAAGTSTLRIAYRPPFDWTGVLAFLQARALAGVEVVEGATYLRTVRIGAARGWIRVTRAMETHELVVEIPHALMPVLPTLLTRVRALFDMDLRPEVVARHLAHDPVLRASVNANPGLRLPGAFDGFETAVRAVLGQQVSVRAASTLAARFVETFGERIETPRADLNRLVPLPDRIAAIPAEDLARIGIPLARARSIVALASEMTSNTTSLQLGGCRDVSEAIKGLCAIPGIGTWTAHYIAMRVLRWPDAFPREDVAIRRALGDATPAEAERRSQQWRPWRSYAVMHLWRLPAPARSGRRDHHR